MESPGRRRRIPFWGVGLIAFAVPAVATALIHASEFTLHSPGPGAYSDSVTMQPSNLVLIVGLALSVVLGVGAGALAAQRKRA